MPAGYRGRQVSGKVREGAGNHCGRASSAAPRCAMPSQTAACGRLGTGSARGLLIGYGLGRSPFPRWHSRLGARPTARCRGPACGPGRQRNSAALASGPCCQRPLQHPPPWGLFPALPWLSLRIAIICPPSAPASALLLSAFNLPIRRHLSPHQPPSAARLPQRAAALPPPCSSLPEPHANHATVPGTTSSLVPP